MKSLTHSLTKVAIGICEDIRLAYPDLVDIDRDINRLSRLSESRGLGFYTLDLPNLDAILLDGLENGRLCCKGPLTSRVSSKIIVPRFLRGLWLRIFSSDGKLKNDPDVSAMFFIRQLTTIGKKIVVPCTTDRIIDSVQKYYGIEETLREPTFKWANDDLFDYDIHTRPHFRDGLDVYLASCEFADEQSAKAFESDLGGLCDRLDKVCRLIATSLGFYDPYGYTSSNGVVSKVFFRHGPGAVSDLKGKYINKYNFPNWPEKLQSIFPYDAFANFAFSSDGYLSDVEMPSKLIAVPKTAKGPRLIASEPTSHQWCQQVTKTYLEEKISSSWVGGFIDFKRQDLSQSMVIEASREGKLATVDLSSASDRLSCWTVERAFISNVSILDALHAHRTRYIIDGVTKAKPMLLQKKFASQGTAVTFPVQTLVFLACALASTPGPITVKSLSKLMGKVRVYGDDIIIPQAGYVPLCTLLQYLGLKVNEDKSFSKGLFRESCGMDAYAGVCITPVKPKVLYGTDADSVMALIDTANNLFRKGMWCASKVVEQIAGNAVKQLPVVGDGIGDIGLFSFCGSDYKHLRSRWNKSYQRQEFLTWSLLSKVRVKSANDYTGITQFLSEKPSPDIKWKSGYRLRPSTSNGRRWVAPGDSIVSNLPFNGNRVSLRG